MTIEFDVDITQNFTQSGTKEWLETNGIGGWASSTISGANTRRYHGLFVPAMETPDVRHVLLSKLDETVILGNREYELSANIISGEVQPKGFQYLQSFHKHFFPQFEYLCSATKIRKTIAALYGENTTLIIYEILESPHPVTLRFLPLFAARNADDLQQEKNDFLDDFHFSNGLFQLRLYPQMIDFFLHIPEANFTKDVHWYNSFEYPLEKFRGLAFHEDLFSPGTFEVTLQPGQELGIIASLENHQGNNAKTLLEQEKHRREKLFVELKSKDDFSRKLCLAADQFIVKRDSYLRSILAGYHWMADDSRDAMIALPGICLATGRFEDARKILRKFAQLVDEGMLPDRFDTPDMEKTYNNADAALWYILAIFKYWQHTKDFEFIRKELLTTLDDIILSYEKGTRHNIQIDRDGMLFAGARGKQLTWMNAEVAGWGVTPRHGKPVEINALWYNVLKILAKFKELAGEQATSDYLTERAQDVLQQFQNKFWNEKRQCLYDYIDRNHSDEAIRPNQIFAISLPFPLFEGEKAEKIVQTVREKLLTPYGLRSLAKSEPAYRSFYGGSPEARQSSYHQGTVWGWLMGAYLTALVRVKGEAGREEARKLLVFIEKHLHTLGVGTLSEIFGAEPPHNPRGCIAHACSVGEILRTYVEDIFPLKQSF
ncbi:MAG: glycogen debranching enzyme N-terminal domain-containing protein [Deferribacteres bacterium]|nr:glycogen debranching enzyme N-terminal domain-containing protein [candidate division KSB1 bacterium]MCB9502119.1 glycogen debranching enzyme N-terminal domain-containing protein [Deferribacteres bacterium]